MSDRTAIFIGGPWDSDTTTVHADQGDTVMYHRHLVVLLGLSIPVWVHSSINTSRRDAALRQFLLSDLAIKLGAEEGNKK